MTEPSNTPAEPPPSYEAVIAGGQSGFQGQPASYAANPAQEGFKYDGVPPYPTQPGYPAQPGYPPQTGYPQQTGYPGQMPYPIQQGAPYPYGANPIGGYPPPPPGTAAYNPQGGVTIVNRNPITGRVTEMQRRRKIFLFIFTFVAICMFIYFVTRVIL